jgi:hypothetical protein
MVERVHFAFYKITSQLKCELGGDRSADLQTGSELPVEERNMREFRGCNSGCPGT